jgi:hypothetical protein
MRLAVHAFAVAGSSVMSMGYIAIALLLNYVPEATIQLIAPALFLRYPAIVRDMLTVSLQGTITGILLYMICVYVALYIFATLYNWFARS